MKNSWSPRRESAHESFRALISRHRSKAMLNGVLLVIGLGILVAGGFLALDVVSLRNLAQASNHVSLARIVFGLRARLPMGSADPAEMLIAILGLCLVGSAIYWEVKARRRLM